MPRPRPRTRKDGSACWQVCFRVYVGGAGWLRPGPFLGEIVERLRACGELEIGDDVAAKLCSMSAATIDRRLAGDRKRLQLEGRTPTKPGSLLKSQIPIRTWAEWDQARRDSWRSTWSATRVAILVGSASGRRLSPLPYRTRVVAAQRDLRDTAAADPLLQTHRKLISSSSPHCPQVASLWRSCNLLPGNVHKVR
jgi:hypothetical protein